jgi:hypothetical protein
MSYPDLNLRPVAPERDSGLFSGFVKPHQTCSLCFVHSSRQDGDNLTNKLRTIVYTGALKGIIYKHNDLRGSVINKVIKNILLLSVSALSFSVYADVSKGNLCRAYIATAYSKDINIIKHISDNNHGQSMVSYVRNDGNRYSYTCEFKGKKIIYSMFDRAANTWGRLRYDEAGTYSISGNKVTINDPMSGKATYTFN